MSSLFSICFLGGWTLPFFRNFSAINSILIFSLKTLILILIFILIRGTLPRFR
jgi:NADH:ubiquinone oxidoreductase subunit H